MIRFALCAAVALAGLPALAAEAPASFAGKALVDAQGRALYVFALDAPGRSACADSCAQAWPPYWAPPGGAANGDFTVVVRPDGKRQWAYRGQALYHYAGDAAPGDARGAGIAPQWAAAPHSFAPPSGY